MGQRALVIAAGVVIAVASAGCGQTWRPLPVGTCVRASDTGEVVVPCAAAHTHRVAAVVAGDGGGCPPETAMFSTPADPHDQPQVTVCYVRDAGGRDP